MGDTDTDTHCIVHIKERENRFNIRCVLPEEDQTATCWNPSRDIKLRPQALIYRIGTSSASSVLHNLATSGHLVFSRTALFYLPLSSIHWIPGIQNVCPFDHQLHRQASLAQAVDDPARQLVHRRRRLQETRTEVITAHPTPPIPSGPIEEGTQSVCYECAGWNCIYPCGL